MGHLFSLPGLNAMRPLHRECLALVAIGINPASVVMHARLLKFPALLHHAFPNMPFETVDNLVCGKSSLVLNEISEWCIVTEEKA